MKLSDLLFTYLGMYKLSKRASFELIVSGVPEYRTVSRRAMAVCNSFREVNEHRDVRANVFATSPWFWSLRLAVAELSSTSVPPPCFRAYYCSRRWWQASHWAPSKDRHIYRRGIVSAVAVITGTVWQCSADFHRNRRVLLSSSSVRPARQTSRCLTITQPAQSMSSSRAYKATLPRVLWVETLYWPCFYCNMSCRIYSRLYNNYWVFV